jgi:hypothetical protein
MDRRRHFDSTPRATYAPTSVIGNCKLARESSYAHAYFIATDWTELAREDGFVLMQAPPGFEIAQEMTERLPC